MRVAVPLEQCWHEVPGGTARASIDLVAALDARPDVEVIGVSARHGAPPPDPWAPPVPVVALPLPRLVLYEAWHGLRRPAIERATGDVDLLHVVGGAVAASRAPMVVTIHDLAFLHHPGMFTKHGLRFFNRALQLTRDEAARVLVPSLATLEDCAAEGFERSRLVHVPWGFASHPVDDAAVAAARSQFGLTGDYVVAVGTLEPRKNLRRLLEAWRMLDRDDVSLVLVGPSGWGDALESSGKPENVTMTGFVEPSTRNALYAGAIASAYPSLFEGFGLPVLESMALGCPVLTSVGTSTEELVADGAGLAVDPHDSAAIAEGLAALLDDAPLRSRLRDRGRARAATYTWDRTVDLTLDAYRAVLS